MSNVTSTFDAKINLPDADLSKRESALLGFDARYKKIRSQLQLVLSAGELTAWSKKHHSKVLHICDLLTDQYPLVVFHGDVGTGKTAAAECVANRWTRESKVEDCLLFKLSSRVRGSGKVGEMGTLLTHAFSEVAQAAGKSRRAVLILDEGDSLASSRTQAHSHHEDKVAVNTLIQCIDEMRKFGGRVVIILCTNRLSVLDPALLRRAAIIEEFQRPTDDERLSLFQADLHGVGLSPSELAALVDATRGTKTSPRWTFSDIRTRLYPAAMARAFPDSPLGFCHLQQAALGLRPSPVMEDK